MNLRKGVTDLAVRLFRSQKGQRFLDRAASRFDFWRGYGSGAYIATSGESVLFDLVRERRRSPSPVILDVGANVGDFSAAAIAALGNDIAVHAFEPAKSVFQKLSARFAGNNRVVLNNFALGREEGEHALFGVERDSGMASLIQRRFADRETSTFQETVRTV